MNEEHDRNSGGKRVILVAGLAVSLVAAYLLVPRPGGFRTSEAGGSAIDGEKGEAAAPRPPGKPRMDLVEHRATETATFAMG